MEILDPWDYNSDFNFILNNNKNKIRGPFSSSDKNNIRYDLDFIYEYNNYEYNNNSKDNFKYSLYIFNDNNNNRNNNLELNFFEKYAIIKSISKSSIYKVSEYLLLGLQIIYRLNYKKCKLEDLSFFISNRKINIISLPLNNSIINEDLSMKIIYIFKYNILPISSQFKPMILNDIFFNLQLDNKNNNKNNNNNNNENNNNKNNNNKNNFNINYNENNNQNNITYKDLLKITNNLLIKLYKISWEDINNYVYYINNIINENKIRNNTKLKQDWLNIYNEWNIFYITYQNILPTPFQSLNFFDFNKNNNSINWLQIYLFSIDSYNISIFNSININNMKESIGMEHFEKLKIILDNCEWINNNIIHQPLIINKI